MENTLVLNSTRKGFLNLCFWSLISIIALWFFASWCSDIIEAVYEAENVTSYSEFSALDYAVKEKYDAIYPTSIVHVGMGLAWIGIITLFLVNLYAMMYLAREKNTLYFNEDGFLNTIVKDRYILPCGAEKVEVNLDRIIQVDVEQRGLNRFLNTGKLRLRLITYTNADSQETWWDVPAVEKPFSKKEKIMSASRDHEGLTIKPEPPADKAAE